VRGPAFSPCAAAAYRSQRLRVIRAVADDARRLLLPDTHVVSRDRIGDALLASGRAFATWRCGPALIFREGNPGLPLGDSERRFGRQCHLGTN
jgi:hypothetical protein